MQSDTSPTTPAPAAPVLTIHTRRLSDLWLPALQEEQAAVEYMERSSALAVGKPRYKPLLTALMAVTRVRDETVEHIRHRGGLLLIGGAA